MNNITKRIGSIKFSCLSPEEIRKMAAVKIITADTYDDEGHPIEQGLMDMHMGVIEPGLRCKTCGCKVDECPGHFGYIDLAEPVTHVGFVKDIKMLLEATCRNPKCGRLMLTEEQIGKMQKRMDSILEFGGDTIDQKVYSKEIAKEASNNTSCPICGADQMKIKLDKPTRFREVEPSHGKDDNSPARSHDLTPKEIRARLELIPDDDLRVLGIDPATCRPEWMILTALAVPPVTVRPSITLDSGDRSEDDLTHKLVDVLRINQRLRENRDAGAPQLIIEDLRELLQYHITTYFDNQTSGTPPARHRSGRSLKTLAQRLKGKEGRFRSNLSGKRVNFSARTVISPDPNLSINEVGVPVIAARELSVPMHVNERNIEKMREYVKRGPSPADDENGYVFGVNYVIRNDGRKIRVTPDNAETVAEGLSIDYVVWRQLIDGDIVLFNRQPSLHRMSIMAHRVRVMKGRTFRFNLCVCAPYNADFDGDEMNLHVLQSEEARAEARIIMQVQENILSPRYGGPIIGGIHDHISGSYFLTHGNPHFGKWETMNILMKLPEIEPPEPAGTDENGEPYWTGRQLFSLVLPDNFNIKFKSSITKSLDKDDPDFDGLVIIRNGQLLEGTIDESAIGNSKGKILEKIARDYGSDRAAKFLNEVTRLALGTIMNHGFSTGISDEDIPAEDLRQISTSSDDAIAKVDELIESFHDQTLEASQGGTAETTLENQIMKVLGDARTTAGNIAGSKLGMSNPAVIMAKTGARGSMTNLSQMAGCVGQQTVRGERISRGYWQRTLPHFPREDLGAYAKGFCKDSYKLGLTPTEFFFHAMGGREGLVDTAVRTSRSGYMQRRLISALEDLKLTSDGTIRNTVGAIVQFKYGEDGVDPARSVRGKAIDIDDLFFEVLGEDAEKLVDVNAKENQGDSYGEREKDLDAIEYDNDFDSDGDEDSTDYESDGDDYGGE